MLYFLIALVIMFSLIDRSLRIGRLERLKLELRFQLFALRDELRLAVINGEAPDNKWFEYLDTTLTKAIDHIQEINLWEALALLSIYKKDKSVLHAQAGLLSALQERENEKISEVYYKLLKTLAGFIMERHAILKAFVVGSVIIARTVNKLAKVVTTAPETSTLLEYSS